MESIKRKCKTCIYKEKEQNKEPCYDCLLILGNPKYEQQEFIGFCTSCGFKIKEFDDKITECPNCASKTIPCHYNHQIDVNINWHELRILCIWAEQWGNKEVQDDGGASSIYSIAQRIQEQFPDMTKNLPLTLAAEVQNMGKEFKLETNIKGVEKDKDGFVK